MKVVNIHGQFGITFETSKIITEIIVIDGLFRTRKLNTWTDGSNFRTKLFYKKGKISGVKQVYNLITTVKEGTLVNSLSTIFLFSGQYLYINVYIYIYIEWERASVIVLLREKWMVYSLRGLINNDSVEI